MNKKCTWCKKPLDISNFYKNKCRKDGHQTACKFCSKTRRAKYYSDHKAKEIENSKNYRKEVRKKYQDYKKSKKCERCSEGRWYVLEFHHKSTDKEHNISDLVWNGSLKRLMEEVKKCEVLCANCHKEEHFGALV